MSENDTSKSRNRAFIASGLGIAVLVAVLLSPFASSHPDGLNRVSADLNFAHREQANPPSQQLPFAQVFDGYALKGLPDGVATSLAGLAGTLATFAIAWGVGKLSVRRTSSHER